MSIDDNHNSHHHHHQGEDANALTQVFGQLELSAPLHQTLHRAFHKTTIRRQVEHPTFSVAIVPAPLAQHGEEEKEESSYAVLRLIPLWEALPVDVQTIVDLPFHLLPRSGYEQRLKMREQWRELLLFPGPVVTSPMLAILDHQHAYTPMGANHQILTALKEVIQVLLRMRMREVANEKEETSAKQQLDAITTMEHAFDQHMDQLHEWYNRTIGEAVDRLELKRVLAATMNGVPIPVQVLSEDIRQRIVTEMSLVLDTFAQRHINLLELHAFQLSPTAFTDAFIPKYCWPNVMAPLGDYHAYWQGIPKSMQTLLTPPPLLDNPPLLLSFCDARLVGITDRQMFNLQLAAVHYAWKVVETIECQNPFFSHACMSEEVRQVIDVLYSNTTHCITSPPLPPSPIGTHLPLSRLRTSLFLCYLQTRFVAPDYFPITTTVAATADEEKELPHTMTVDY